MDRLSRRDSLILLAILGTGVFLAGLELMITAVALPAIVTDLASWTRLREASWIINGYLLVYVVTMPVAGRLATSGAPDASSCGPSQSSRWARSLPGRHPPSSS